MDASKSPCYRKPDFFVVDDDMYGNSVRIEASCRPLKPPLLDELFMLLAPLRDWSVYLALINGGLWVFRDRVCVKRTCLRIVVQCPTFTIGVRSVRMR